MVDNIGQRPINEQRKFPILNTDKVNENPKISSVRRENEKSEEIELNFSQSQNSIIIPPENPLVTHHDISITDSKEQNSIIDSEQKTITSNYHENVSLPPNDITHENSSNVEISQENTLASNSCTKNTSSVDVDVDVIKMLILA